jgi:hypothetical protein
MRARSTLQSQALAERMAVGSVDPGTPEPWSTLMSVSQELRGEVLDQHLDRVADQLTRKFADRSDAREIHDAVYSEARRYREARITQYIPVLVQHAVQERLRRAPITAHRPVAG